MTLPTLMTRPPEATEGDDVDDATEADPDAPLQMDLF